MSERSPAKKCTINVSGLLLSLTLAVGGILADGIVVAQPNYEPSALRSFTSTPGIPDAKFGMFIHWDVYTVLGDGEWVFHNRKLTGR